MASLIAGDGNHLAGISILLYSLPWLFKLLINEHNTDSLIIAEYNLSKPKVSLKKKKRLFRMSLKISCDSKLVVIFHVDCHNKTMFLPDVYINPYLL